MSRKVLIHVAAAALSTLALSLVAAQPDVSDTVVCEPQGGANPSHPSTYWYDVTPDQYGRCDFHVQVFDPDSGHYTSPTKPNATWQFAVHKDGDEWWASWWDPGCLNAIFSKFRFQFTNSRNSMWSRWATTIDGSWDPHAQVVDESAEHSQESDGYGHYVHAPTAPGIRFYVDENNDGAFDAGEEIPKNIPVLYLKKNSPFAVVLNTQETGRISYSGASADDKLFTSYIAYEHPAIKGQRSYAGSMFDLYMDTDGVSNTGSIRNRRLTSAEASTLNAGGVVHVRLGHPVFSWNMVVALNWNADSTYISDLKDGLREASNYLFDLTDGQAKLGRIHIRNNVAETSDVWKQADIRIFDDDVWPVMTGGYGVLKASGTAWVHMPRYFNGSDTESGDPDESRYYRTVVHELGHYLFDFWDEYKDGNANTSAFRTFRQSNPHRAVSNHGFMDHQHGISEMSSFNDYLQAAQYTGQPASAMSRQVWEYRVRTGGAIEPCWDHYHGRFDNSGGTQTLWTGYGGFRVAISTPPYGIFFPIYHPSLGWLETRTSSDRSGPSGYYPSRFGNFTNVVRECYFSTSKSQATPSMGEAVTVERTAEKSRFGPGLLLDAGLEVVGPDHMLRIRLFSDESLVFPPNVVAEPRYGAGIPVPMAPVEPQLWEGILNIGEAMEGGVSVEAEDASGMTAIYADFEIEEHVDDRPAVIHGPAGWLDANLPADLAGTDFASISIDSGSAPIPPPDPMLIALTEPVSFGLQDGVAVGVAYVLNWRLAPSALSGRDANLMALYKFREDLLVWEPVPATFTPGYRSISAADVSGGIYGVFAQDSSDVLPPAQITDLAADTGEDGQGVTLTWTAPGDDEMSGQAVRYHLHAGTEPITAENLERCLELSIRLEPQSAGTLETYSVEMPEPDEHYYFVIRAQDEAENIGPLSNVAAAVSHVTDSDIDGLPDYWEEAHGFDPATSGDELLDPDLDGLDNLQEYEAGTDPLDPDTDTDGSADGPDCAPLDGSAFGLPEEVSELEPRLLDELGTTEVVWLSQDETAGSGTTYDLIAGSLEELLADGSFVAATCLADGLPPAPFVDTRQLPEPENGDYYLLRALNACGTGTYGSSAHDTNHREFLDLHAPCP